VEVRLPTRSDRCNCVEPVVFWWCRNVDCGETHESLNRGPEPMGIIIWKHERLVVSFSGEWAA
jgi:hypothetical protein